ncbi:PepSY domain-containing protein [Modestobacter lapidis]|nr:hypothetical protein [Modestobacter lapidis]
MGLRKRVVVVTAATAVGLAAAGGIAVAADGNGGDELGRPGTVPVDESTLPEDDAAEQTALADLAAVDEAAAGTAAVESVGGGDVAGSELEEEDGFVVWEVTVRATDGSVHEVTVDAGDAGVLSTEREDDDSQDDDSEDDDGADDDSQDDDGAEDDD